MVPNWFSKGLVVCITVSGCVHLKYPLESVEKSRGLSPGSGFLSVADMSITVTNMKFDNDEIRFGSNNLPDRIGCRNYLVQISSHAKSTKPQTIV